MADEAGDFLPEHGLEAGLANEEFTVDNDGYRQETHIGSQIVLDRGGIDGERGVEFGGDDRPWVAISCRALQIDALLRNAQIFTARRADQRRVRLDVARLDA